MPENNTHSYPPNVGSDATTTKPTVAPNTVQPILLPILILPLDVPADKISTSTIMSAFSRVLANTCGSINLPSAVAAAQSRTSYLPTTLTENQAIGNFIDQSIQDGSLSISAATATALQDTVMTSVALQQNSQGRVSCAFAKVADVGTATMCLTDACVQTDFYGQSASAHLNKSAPLISVKTGTDNDNIADVFFKMADFSVGTSPPALISAGNSPPCFIAPVACADTYMTSAKSIQLQYPEMNSNGTMTQPHQFACGDQLFGQKPDRTEFISAPQQAPQSSLEGHFQSQPPPFCHMFSHTAATATSSCSGESSQSCYTPPSSIASSFCATPNPSSSNSVFSFNPPRSLIDISQQFSWPEQSRGVMANSCISSEPDYLNRQAVNNEYLSRRDQQPTFSSDIPARGSDAAETQYTASWVSLHPQADLPSNELSIGCGVSTPTLPTAPKTSTSLCHANSVAVETTVDLMNFNDNNAGNCCWSPADSFSHMQTQTTGDAELDQWLNSVHTQTAFQQTASGVAASSSASWLSTDNGVCVGVNTDLRTLEGCNQFV
ncbi:unnamed protein product [Schistocephalus solidus]|uniref:Uncharacterized protein n=1 Tax=Schistocephalus solidus TaxID=70667 RepID=A0A183SS04_SCHSO|nr:unnamed protein product [Schistocephalus solidus]